MKLNSSLVISYSTLIGGPASTSASGDDRANGIAVDSSGNAYVTGVTNSATYPTTTGAFLASTGSDFETFVTKINSTGTSLTYSTLVGGYTTSGYGIALDISNNAYITGETSYTSTHSNNVAFTVTTDATQSTNHAGNTRFNAFLCKFNSTGTSLIFSTYHGGTNNSGRGVSVFRVPGLASNRTYICGITDDNLPLSNASQSTYGGSYDGFVAKWNGM